MNKTNLYIFIEWIYFSPLQFSIQINLKTKMFNLFMNSAVVIWMEMESNHPANQKPLSSSVISITSAIRKYIENKLWGQCVNVCLYVSV